MNDVKNIVFEKESKDKIMLLSRMNGFQKFLNNILPNLTKHGGDDFRNLKLKPVGTKRRDSLKSAQPFPV